MKKRLYILGWVIAILSMLQMSVETAWGQSALMPTHLRCEYRENPLGIDSSIPRLAWKIEDRGQTSEIRGQKQTAYQVLVASTPELLAKDQGDLWDSKKVASDQSIQVEYGGKPLESRAYCHWKVRVWVNDGKPTAWSAPAFWSMGLLKRGAGRRSGSRRVAILRPGCAGSSP